MSIAKQLIGEPAPKPAVTETETVEEVKPVHAMDLIDALAQQEFGQPIQDAKKACKKPEEGKAPGKAMKQGKAAGGEVVAKSPGAVKYGKK